MSERALVGWFLLLFVVILGVVGRFDYEDAVASDNLSREIRATAPAWAVTE